jgi:hypothetical protein
MRSAFYEILSVALLLGSGYFFFRGIGFLASADYVSGLAVVIIGIAVMRTGLELTRLSVMLRREES